MFWLVKLFQQNDVNKPIKNEKFKRNQKQQQLISCIATCNCICNVVYSLIDIDYTKQLTGMMYFKNSSNDILHLFIRN